MSPRQYESLGRMNLFQKSEFWYNEMEIHASRKKDMYTSWDCCTEHGLEDHRGSGGSLPNLKSLKRGMTEQHRLASHSYGTMHCFNKSTSVLDVQFQGHT